METRTYGRVRLPLVLWGLVLAACAPAGPSFNDEDRAAIARVTSQVLEIANTSKDWAEYARLYHTEDAVFGPSSDDEGGGAAEDGFGRYHRGSAQLSSSP